MKKSLCIILFVFCSALELQSQQLAIDRGSFCGFTAKNGYYTAKKDRVFNATLCELGDESGIADVVAQIKEKLIFQVNIIVYLTEDSDNCFATILKGGNRILIVNPLFLNDVNLKTGNKWSAISIISHEIGHHISGFGRHSNAIEGELDADYWSGFILKKLGAQETDAIKCMQVYAKDEESITHPKKSARISMIKNGWDDAANGIIDYSKCDHCQN